MTQGRGRSAGGVTIESLNLSFGDTHVLKGIDLHIEPGEFFAFLGPSAVRRSGRQRAGVLYCRRSTTRWSLAARSPVS